MNSKALTLLILLAFMQGTAFLFIKILVNYISPFSIVFLRVSLALPLLYIAIFFKYKNTIPNLKPYGGTFLLLSLTSIIIPFSLISWAGKFIPSGISSVYMALIPIFVAVFESLFRKTFTFSKFGYLGLLLGFSGIILLFFDGFTSSFQKGIFGHILCFLSAIFYAFSVYQTKKLSNVPPLLSGTVILTLASILLFPFFVFIFPIHAATFKLILFPISGIAIISTASALMLMYYLIEKVGTVITATTNYLVPIFGIGLGYFFLHEKVSFLLLPAILCIFCSLYLVSKDKN